MHYALRTVSVPGFRLTSFRTTDTPEDYLHSNEPHFNIGLVSTMYGRNIFENMVM